MKKIHTKKGAASFYIVAFSTLILVIIAISFATVVLAEVARTSNADLSRSAYDAALAGIEDAKIAFLKYKNCLKDMSSDSNCAAIVAYMENPNCDMVAHILSRYGENESGEVPIKETQENDNQMNQAYTCVIINTTLSDYRSSVSSSNPTRVVNVDLDGISASEVTAIQFSWYSDNNGTEYDFANIQEDDGKVTFPSLDSAVGTPPVISLQLIQTSNEFSLADFDKTQGERTNRGTIYLVPTDVLSVASNNMEGNHFAAANQDGNNSIGYDAFLRSNNHGEDGTNLPHAVYCDPDSDSEFLCSTKINLPEPIGGTRSDDTFSFVISLPYGTPNTDFSIQLYCGESNLCAKEIKSEDGSSKDDYNVFQGIQVSIDSTGRANDLYRRIEARLETTDIYFPYPEYTIQLFGSDSNKASIDKDIYTTIEYGL